MRLGVDSDAEQSVASCNDGGAVARAMRHAADDAAGPPGYSVRVGEDRNGGHADLPERLAGAVPDRGELRRRRRVTALATAAISTGNIVDNGTSRTSRRTLTLAAASSYGTVFTP